MNLIKRAKNIIINPSQTWIEIKNEEMSIREIYLSYAVILASIPAVAQFIGNALIGYSIMGLHFRMNIISVLGYSIVSYVLSLVGIYILALIVNAMAPSFGSEQNLTNAMKAVTFSMTPLWLAGIFYIIPTLSILAILVGLYGIYLFYLGLPILMNTPKDKALIYAIVVIVLTFVINLLISAITSTLFISMPAIKGMM